MKKLLFFFALICMYLLPVQLPAQQPAPKPLYSDPVHDGAADPVIAWNKKEKQ